ncbi:hypothetical protein IM774_07040 [Erysipelotrichaceae bacterium RD49]|nr:hypothetical protein [Erysipelotrichaceae bacterium RD49]
MYRNRRIGDLLQEIKLIEGRNTGFPNALAALEENGSPTLHFEYDDQRQFLSVSIPIHPSFIQRNRKEDRALVYQKMIWDCLAEAPLSMTELAKKLGHKGITARLRRNVDILLERKDLVSVTGQKGQTLLALRSMK